MTRGVTLVATILISISIVPPNCVWASEAAARGGSEVLEEAPIGAGDREHWAFREIVRPPLPAVQDASWPRNAIDRFILARLEEAGLKPAPAASPAVLLRRIAFDLVGLPPSADPTRQRTADRYLDAYEQEVDRLLAAPGYGERWAQYWLDLARFAETDGFEFDKERPTAWQFRDWVVEALNSDLPYDQFVQCQIAGDLLAAGSAGSAIATAFCVSGSDMPDINSQEERKQSLLNEMTGTVGAVFMGLQVGCAQCHDHMFDPVSQADFYRLRAFFQPAVHVKRDVSITGLSTSDEPSGPSHLLIRGDWRRPGPELQAAYLRIANPDQLPVDFDSAVPPRLQLARWLTGANHPLTARVFVNRLWQYHFGRGLCDTPSDFGYMGSAPTHPELLDWLARELIESGWQVKRLQRLIVTSATYRQSSYPQSATDRSGEWAESFRRDAGGELLSRYPRRRLEAEAVRDAMYAVSGSLDRRMKGPGIRPPLPQEMVDTLIKDQWNVSERKADHYRRSLYVFARRNLRYPLFAELDRPAAMASCAVRAVSTTAPQSLMLLNSDLSIDAARRLAGRVWRQAGSDPSCQATAGWMMALGRSPCEAERHALQTFLIRQTDLIAATGRDVRDLALPITSQPIDPRDQFAAAALTDMCLALLNMSEFLYLD